METVRSVLAREIVGKRIKAVAITNGRVVRRHKSAKEFRDRVEGRTVKSVSRLGKYLVVGLDDGTKMVIHLGMSGQLLRAKSPKDLKPKHTHVVVTFTQGGELRFVDPRTFGELFVSMPVLAGQSVDISKFARLSIGGDGLALRAAVPGLLGQDPRAASAPRPCSSWSISLEMESMRCRPMNHRIFTCTSIPRRRSCATGSWKRSVLAMHGGLHSPSSPSSITCRPSSTAG